jgi:hypothetical protein
MATNKKSLACRVSSETFEAVKALTEGENCPFESTTEYLQTLIISDLAQRKMGGRTLQEEIIDILRTPEMKRLIKEIANSK